MKLHSSSLTNSTFLEEMRIYEMARQEYAWNPKLDIPWRQPWGLQDGQEDLAWKLASQSVCAEEIGLLVSAKLLLEADDAPTRMCLATAVSDEAKHCEVFARFSLAVGGDIDKPAPQNENLLEVLLKLDPVSRFMIHTLLEGLARDEFKLFNVAFRKTILNTIYSKVIFDESRHVAMGLIYLKNAVKKMSTGEFEQLYHDVKVIFELTGIDQPGAFAWLATLIDRPSEWVQRFFVRQNHKRIHAIFHERINFLEGR